MRTVRAVFLAIAVLCFGSGAIAGDSGIFGSNFRDLTLRLSNQATPESGLTVITYGETLFQKLPLTAYRWSDSGAAGAKIVVVTEALHGDEYLNITDRLMGYFLGHRPDLPSLDKFLKQGGIIYFVPVANPVGYDGRQRGNGVLVRGKSVDLNRDFNRDLRSSQRESRLLAEMLESERIKQQAEIVFALDYHCCAKSIFYPWSKKRESVPEKDLVRLVELGKIMSKSHGGLYPVQSGWDATMTSAAGTLKDYFYSRYGALSYTFEGVAIEEAGLLLEHVKMWEQIFDYLGGA